MAATRSPSVDRICAAAVAHFADRGYDASSLNEIAEQVGIRKASLYSHFAGKDELFREVFTEALALESDFARQCFDGESDAAAGDLPGAAYCGQIAARYRESPHLRFLLRTAYLPPAALRSMISPSYEGYLLSLRELFQAGLAARAAVPAQAIDTFAEAYLGILDSLHVELVYADAATFERRRAALWRVLTDSVRMASGV